MKWFLIIIVAAFSSCSRPSGTYVDVNKLRDTLIVFDDYTFQTKFASVDNFNNGELKKYKIEGSEIIFVNYPSKYFDRGSIHVMEIDRPIFRSKDTRIVYNPDLEKGYFRRIGPVPSRGSR